MRMLMVAATATVLLTACVPSSQTGTSYSRDEARKVQNILIGQVLDIQQVEIEGTKSGLGGVVGGAAGGVAASTVGGGTGKDLATIGGAVIGAAIGAVAEEALTKATGEEYTIRLSTDEIISVVQAVDANDPNRIQVGDTVKVLQQQGTYRINKLPNPELLKTTNSDTKATTP